jgi:hypothetical protein
MDGEGLTTDQLKSLEEYLPTQEEEGQVLHLRLIIDERSYVERRPLHGLYSSVLMCENCMHDGFLMITFSG